MYFSVGCRHFVFHMTTNSQEDMESQESNNSDNFEKEPGGQFELRKRQVVECAKETIENGRYATW